MPIGPFDAAPTGRPLVGILFGGYPQAWHADLLGRLGRRGYDVRLAYAEGMWTAANGGKSVLDEQAAALVRMNPSVILTTDTPGTLAAAAATPSIPIVAPIAASPVRAPILEDVTNIIGLSDDPSSSSAMMRVSMIIELLGGASKVQRVAVIWNSSNFGKDVEIREIQEARRELRPAVIVDDFPVVCPAYDFASVMHGILDARDPYQAVFVQEDPVVFQNHLFILSALRTRGIPGMWDSAPPLAAGGLCAFGPDRLAAFRWAANMTDQVIQGNWKAGTGNPNFGITPIPHSQWQCFVNPAVAQSFNVPVPRTLQGSLVWPFP